MRVIIQRVRFANITIDNAIRREIKQGLVVLLGIEADDGLADINWLTGKISRLRIFNDDKGLMNLSVQDINGEIMVVSQFTLHASIKKGNRPAWIKAAAPAIAVPLYNKFIEVLQQTLKTKIITGEFGAHMDIELLNDGPVTIFVDSKKPE